MGKVLPVRAKGQPQLATKAAHEAGFTGQVYVVGREASEGLFPD